MVHNKVAFLTHSDDGRNQYPDGLEIDDISSDEMTYDLGDPLSVRVAYTRHLVYKRDAWQVTIAADCAMWCGAQNFYLHHHLVAFEGDLQVFEKEWDRTIPRHFL